MMSSSIGFGGGSASSSTSKKKLTFREEAAMRAAAASTRGGEHHQHIDNDYDGRLNVGHQHHHQQACYPQQQQYYPQQQQQQYQQQQYQQQQHLGSYHGVTGGSTSSMMMNGGGASSNNFGNHPPGNGGNPTTASATTTTAKDARNQWKQYGTTLSQAFEDQRSFGAPTSSNVGVGAGGGIYSGILQARIVSAESRVDAGGSSYTAYIVRVLSPTSSPPGAAAQANSSTSVVESWIERRYSDFDKLNAALKEDQQKQNKGSAGTYAAIDAAFPSKHWAGRLGPWTPSKLVAPTQHLKLVEYRCRQLDIWLVHVLQAYHDQQQTMMSAKSRCDVEKFLFGTPEQMTPSSSTSNSSSSMKWYKYINPVSFSLGNALKQAERTLQYMTDCEDDKSIPLDLLKAAKGLAFMTVAKGGCVVSGKVGTGLVLARLGDGNNNNACRWSSPCAVGTIGLGWGAQIGGDVTHYLIVLTTPEAVRDLVSRNKSVQLGAELGVALGPVGRSAHSHVATGDWTLHPAYSYAHSKGLFVGVSLEGSVVSVRDDVNAKFYGSRVDAPDLLARPGPTAAQPLYAALDAAVDAHIPEGSWRPYSQIFLQENQQNQPQHICPPMHQHQQQTTVSTPQQQGYVAVNGGGCGTPGQQQQQLQYPHNNVVYSSIGNISTSAAGNYPGTPAAAAAAATAAQHQYQ